MNGKPEHHPEGVYNLRYVKAGKRVWDAVGIRLILGNWAKRVDSNPPFSAIIFGKSLQNQLNTTKINRMSIIWHCPDCVYCVSGIVL